MRFALAVLLALAASVEHPRWTIVGPGGGGAQFNPTVSPHDPNRVLVSCDMTGAYLTEDGGRSWRMFNLGSTVRFFAFDPADARVAYAQTTRLWRSQDGGKSWHTVYPADARVEIEGDHAEERVVSAVAPIDALAVDSGTLWAGAGKSLQSSPDGGRTWTAAGELPGRARRIYVEKGTVYVLGADFAAIRGAGGLQTFAHPPFADVAAGSDGERMVLYGAAREGLFVSSDGEHWRKTGLGGAVRAVAACRRKGRVAYASYRGDSFGVARTSDAGQTWEPVWSEKGNSKSPHVDDGWVSDRFGPGWGEYPLALAVAPSNPDSAWATDLGRTLHTTDGGKTWTNAYTRRLPDGSFASRGLDVTTTYGVHFDPFDARHLFISYTDIGLFVSENGGQGWHSATLSGVPRPWVNTTYWLEFDRDVRGRMWAAMSGTHDLPRPKMWRRRSPETFQGGICRSDDGGKTWRALTSGMPPSAATHILLDRRSTPAARTLYVAAFGRGVFRSDDGGESWSLKNRGLPEHEPFAWRLAQDGDGVLYLVIARRSEDGSIGTDADGALYRSADRAESWEKVNLPARVNGPNGLAIDPGDPRRLYLAAWARTGAANGGIYLSTDRGASWSSVLTGDQHVYDVTIDPRDAKVLYACGFESAAWRSDDRGATWRRIAGYDFKWGHRVIPDPADPASVYVTTFGGSVWHGPGR